MLGEETKLAPCPRISRARNVTITVLISIFLAVLLGDVAAAHFATPGMFAARKLVSANPGEGWLAHFGERLIVCLTLDSALCFVLISGLLVILDKLRHKSPENQN